MVDYFLWTVLMICGLTAENNSCQDEQGTVGDILVGDIFENWFHLSWNNMILVHAELGWPTSHLFGCSFIHVYAFESLPFLLS